MKTKEVDKNCPAGYRFLVQLIDIHSEGEAKDVLCRMFGQRKGEACVLVPGTHQPKSLDQWTGTWEMKSTGHRAYLPTSFKD